MNVLFTFETVSAALDCEGLFKELEIPCRIIPVPRALSASCAYALTAETADVSGLRETLRQQGAGYVKVFRYDAALGRGETYELLAGPGGREKAERDTGGK
ncbi:MAG: DUF3343 domain-containing protein [Treponema sp.]|nr:DUF3343 domain-containing protein [Treponema sp.]